MSQSAILDLVEDNPNVVWSVEMLSKELGVPRDHVRRALRRLEKWKKQHDITVAKIKSKNNGRFCFVVSKNGLEGLPVVNQGNQSYYFGERNFEDVV